MPKKNASTGDQPAEKNGMPGGQGGKGQSGTDQGKTDSSKKKGGNYRIHWVEVLWRHWRLTGLWGWIRGESRLKLAVEADNCKYIADHADSRG